MQLQQRNINFSSNAKWIEPAYVIEIYLQYPNYGDYLELRSIIFKKK